MWIEVYIYSLLSRMLFVLIELTGYVLDTVWIFKTAGSRLTHCFLYYRFFIQWTLFSHRLCLSGPWGRPVFDLNVLSPHFLKWIYYNFQEYDREQEVHLYFYTSVGERDRFSLSFIITEIEINYSFSSDLSSYSKLDVLPSYCCPVFGLYCKSWLHDIVYTVQYLQC